MDFLLIGLCHRIRQGKLSDRLLEDPTLGTYTGYVKARTWNSWKLARACPAHSRVKLYKRSELTIAFAKQLAG